MNTTHKTLIAAGAIVAIAVLASFRTVDVGHVGIVTTFGKPSRDVLDPGAHFVNPFSRVTGMSVQVRRGTHRHEAASRDLQDVLVDLGTNFHLRPDAALAMFERVGADWETTIISNAESETLKAVIATFPVADVLARRVEIKASVSDALAAWLTKYGIELDEVSISNISFSPEYADAIEAKQVEEQRALQRTYELQGAQTQAEIAKAKARGEADAAIEKARGEAQTITLRADAQATANERLARSLSGPGGDAALLSVQIEKWNGVLPATIAGGDGRIFVTTNAGK